MSSHMALLALILILPFLASCENHIDLRPDSQGAHLCLNAYIDADSLQHQLLVTLTGAHQPTKVSGAHVMVSINGTPETEAVENNYHQGYYEFSARFSPGDLVRIEVLTADGAHMAFAEEYVPRPAELEDVAPRLIEGYTSYEAYNEYGAYLQQVDAYQLRLRINDASETPDYYRLHTNWHIHHYFAQQYPWRGEEWEVNEQDYRQEGRFDGNQDPIFMEGHTITSGGDFDFPSLGHIENKQGVFSDRLFNGKEATVTIYETVPNVFLKKSEPQDEHHSDESEGGIYQTRVKEHYSGMLTVTLETISASEYYYLKALNTRDSDVYDDTSDLTGPIKTPTNVHGGSGMVGFHTSRSVTLPLYRPEE